LDKEMARAYWSMWDTESEASSRDGSGESLCLPPVEPISKKKPAGYSNEVVPGASVDDDEEDEEEGEADDEVGVKDESGLSPPPMRKARDTKGHSRGIGPRRRRLARYAKMKLRSLFGLTKTDPDRSCCGSDEDEAMRSRRNSWWGVYWRIHSRKLGHLPDKASDQFGALLGALDPELASDHYRACVHRSLMSAVMLPYPPGELGEERWRWVYALVRCADELLSGQIAGALGMIMHMSKAELEARRARSRAPAKFLFLLPTVILGSGSTQVEETGWGAIAVSEARAVKLTKGMRS
jgi:hypothetical protein